MKAPALSFFSAALSLALAPIVYAQSPAASSNATSAPVPAVQMPAFHVEAEAEADHFVQGPFLPDTQGTHLNAGKKTSSLDFDSLPRINGNNYRQALAQAPGLVLSEETS